jgi:hypothetical protein
VLVTACRVSGRVYWRIDGNPKSREARLEDSFVKESGHASQPGGEGAGVPDRLPAETKLLMSTKYRHDICVKNVQYDASNGFGGRQRNSR